MSSLCFPHVKFLMPTEMNDSEDETPNGFPLQTEMTSL